MEKFYNTADLRKELAKQRCASRSIGFVPTLGSLHEGHASLIRASLEDADITVCSIFINPTQFDDPADLEKYPRDPEKDLEKLEKLGCDVLFAPSAEEMYSARPLIQMAFPPLDSVMEGRHRPGHFNGVTMVVAKLFNIVRPDVTFFGQKDFQQYRIIERMIRDLSFDIRIVCCPVVREKDGLALSSRNKRLGENERREAMVLYDTLTEVRRMLLNDKSVSAVKEKAEEKIKKSNARLEYFEVADADDLQPLQDGEDPRSHNQVVLCVAAWMGDVRLIDNVLLFQ